MYENKESKIKEEITKFLECPVCLELLENPKILSS